MRNEIDLCGTHIPINDIKDYRVVYREYIYRPVYKECEGSLKRLIGGKYEFAEMIPFAAILSKEDREFKLATADFNAKTIRDSIIKDVAIGAMSLVTHKIERKHYRCKNIAGRVFSIYLDDVPASVIRADGRIIDVYKNDELYPQLGEPIAPTILTIKALQISASKETHLFYGNRIQLNDADETYQHLRQTISDFEESARIEQQQPQKQLSINAKAEKISNKLPKLFVRSEKK